ncbi:LysR family transcriptional regulator [Iodidimonas sp. SYSU 1G8]|uniref:LysR family transcriptional regulator n=1 Tax=Iodidimonas sp. SYSU 1G8 TaxID=3133967 RepID=UPI0031FEEE74
MDWDKLRTFYSVAKAGSFTHASDELNLSQSAISRQISGLEESLGFSLFHRHPRGLILTEQGETLFETVSEVFVKLERTEAILRDSRTAARGRLNVTTTVGFGSTWLVPHLREFQLAYPDIGINLLLSDSEIDIAMRESDAAIRFHPPHQPDLIQRQLMTVHYHIYASPEYVAKHGAPKTTQELDDHAIISYGPEAPRPLQDLNWIIHAGAGDRVREPVLAVNNIYGILKAVESGLGLAALPDYIATPGTNLVQVLPDLEGPTFKVYFVYPEELRNVTRITVFRDFLVDQVRSGKF